MWNSFAQRRQRSQVRQCLMPFLGKRPFAFLLTLKYPTATATALLYQFNLKFCRRGDKRERVGGVVACTSSRFSSTPFSVLLNRLDDITLLTVAKLLQPYVQSMAFCLYCVLLLLFISAAMSSPPKTRVRTYNTSKTGREDRVKDV